MNRPALIAKVLVFVVTTSLLTAGLVIVFGKYRFDTATTYQAVFTDVSGMDEGSEVKAAGVDLGRVEGLHRLPDNTIEVTFSVNSEVPLTTGTTAMIRYKNLVGDRYLQLRPGPGTPLRPGETIPPTHTQPALDLDELYNGFTPLFQGLQPAQINQLSASLIEVLQGQESAVDDLLAELGSVTTTLADRATVIDSVITHLNTVLTTLNNQTPQLNDTIVNLQRLTSGLAAQRDQIGTSLARTNDLTSSLSSLLAQQRPGIAGTIGELGRAAGQINSDQAQLDNLFRRLPGYYIPLGRLGSAQGAFQFYVCGVRLRVPTPTGPVETPFINSGNTPRCAL